MKTFAMAVALLLCLAGSGQAQDDPKKDPKDPKDPKGEKPVPKLLARYGYAAQPKLYPQKTPRETLESIIKAIIDQRMEYKLAHLADPEYVDGRVARYMTGGDRGAEL